jgi:hypothetical protein
MESSHPNAECQNASGALAIVGVSSSDACEPTLLWIGAEFRRPVAHSLCRHLRAAVRVDVLRLAAFKHHIGHRLYGA